MGHFRESLFVSLAVVLVGAGIAPIRAQEEVDTGLHENVAVRLRSQRVRLEVPEPYPADSCRNLSLANLSVRVGDDPIPTANLVELERRLPGTDRLLHAILLDTSGSMNGDMSALREAAREYLARIDPARERAMIMTFDESVVLLQAPTSDLSLLNRAVDRVRMGGWTSLRDGVRYAVEAIQGYEGRPVLVLLTDGADSHSLYDNHEVLDEIYENPDLTIFTVGLKLPAIRPGQRGVSPMKILAQLAKRSNGRFFNIARGDRLSEVFEQIRELLDREAIVTWIDPDPDRDLAELGEAPQPKIEIRSNQRGCKVETLQAYGVRKKRRQVEDRTPPSFDSDGILRVNPGKAFLDLVQYSSHPLWKDGCLPDKARAGWLRVDEGRVDACLLDLVVAGGYLHDAWTVSRASKDVNPVLRWRSIEADWPTAIDALPERPSAWMDTLAAAAVELPEFSPLESPLKKPSKKYARPHQDHPNLISGRTLLEMRPALAVAMARNPEFRAFAQMRIGERRKRVVSERLTKVLAARPDLDEREVRQWIEDSDVVEGGATHVADARELQPFLAAWLGDIAGHDLFVQWELERLQSWIVNGNVRTQHPDEFSRDWSALHRIFRLSSYSRILAPLLPGWDPEERRIGFWRVILPRPSWLLQRLRSHKPNSDWADLPLDLVPDRPFAYELLHEVYRVRPEALQNIGRILSLRYELRGKLYKRDPARAYRSFAMILEYAAKGSPGRSERRTVTLNVELDDLDSPIAGLDLEPIFRALAAPQDQTDLTGEETWGKSE